MENRAINLKHFAFSILFFLTLFSGCAKSTTLTRVTVNPYLAINSVYTFENKTKELSDQLYVDLGADAVWVSLYHPTLPYRIVVTSTSASPGAPQVIRTDTPDQEYIKSRIIEGGFIYIKVLELPTGTLKDFFRQNKVDHIAAYPIYNRVGNVEGFIGVRWDEGNYPPSASKTSSILQAGSDKLKTYNQDLENYSNYVF